MSEERELLEKILATRWLDHELSCEAEKLLSQPEQEPEQNIAGAVMPNGVCVSNVYDAYEEGRKSLMSEQEPEAWILEDKKTGYRRQSAYKPTNLDEEACNVIPLYTAPPKREPLSDDVIADRSKEGSFEYRDGFMDGVLFAENHHGITGGEG